ncbi:MAG: YcaO-like family protein [Bauldia sp.]|uniref:YcaO-like family protein n=1 Tax=Bauldia sp. TaxID=2575872 RepID=UPI001DCC8A4D|nr:YcaO-like family protein [Bauldia sp.]MCB1497409.1 YcaO-like family protein [Bauldia sp.]
MTGAAVLPAAYRALCEPDIGIVGAFDETAVAPDAPRYRHYRARLCDMPTIGGVATGRMVDVAAADSGGAISAAIRQALSRYCAALYDRSGLPVATAAEAQFTCLPPADFALFSEAQYARPGYPYVPFLETTPVRWTTAVNLATGETIHAPAAMVWFPCIYQRGEGDQPIVCPDSAGLGSGEGVAAAALAGLCDVVARDAGALFWRASIQPPRLRTGTLPPRLRDLVHRFRPSGDPVALLDVTTDNRIPAFVAVVTSDRRDRPAHVFAVAAGPDPEAACATVLARLAANRRVAAGLMREGPAPVETNDWEDVIEPADHMRFAADHDNRSRFAFALESDERIDLADCESAATGTVGGDLEAMIGRIMATGYQVYAANLTSADIGGLGLNVCRAIVPGYQTLFAGHHLRTLGGRRLYDAPQRLGHRGIAAGSAGNPAPHPFA